MRNGSLSSVQGRTYEKGLGAGFVDFFLCTREVSNLDRLTTLNIRPILVQRQSKISGVRSCPRVVKKGEGGWVRSRVSGKKRE